MSKFKNREISEEILNNFIYDEDSPTCLIWKTGDRKGKYAGCIPTREDTPYVKIMIAGVTYLAHRIIWTMFNGPIPKDMVIDHLDRNPSNNRLSNLQLKTTAQNFRNRKKSKKNTSGVTGVSTVKDRKGVVYAYKAIWMEEGKQRSKQYSIQNCKTEEKAKESAIVFRIMKIKELSERGYGYSDDHGEETTVLESCPVCCGCGFEPFKFDMNKRVFTK